ncbi:hypothetical protein GW17_00035203 [Ensete ventricosum]|nr:hypothetical protein GW17_00035203 [Ensete ventricosum]
MKDYFKLRVMRLYHVESFYVFLLHYRSEGSEEEGWPATTNPHARSVTHGQPAGVTPAGRSAARGVSIHPRGQQPLAAWRPQRGLAIGRPQGAAARDQPCR